MTLSRKHENRDVFARVVANILNEECGALRSRSSRWSFLTEFSGANHAQEWRLLSGTLGFGGKLRTHKTPWYVDCYSEDLTPDRQATIDRINARLEKLWGVQ